MTTNFQTFEKQYSTASAEAINQLNQYDLTSDGSYLHKAQKFLDDMQDYVEQMEMEGGTTRQARQTAKAYKTEFQQIESRWKRLRETQKRHDLLTNSQNSQHAQQNSTSFTGATAGLSNSDRERLLTTEKLERGTRKLEDGHRIALDTEQYGREILEELQREREVLERSKNRLHHANTMLGASTDVVTQMYRHVVQDRLTLYVIAAVLALIVLVVLFSKIF